MVSGVFDPDVFDPAVFDTGERRGGGIETWVTTLGGAYLAHLERSEASPFRGFKFSRELGATGVGSLEYNLDNELVASFDDLFAFTNLVWMRYRDRTFTWIIEGRRTVLDKGEHATDWVQVAGRGTRQLLEDRLAWPSEFDEAHTNPLLWGVGGWKTKTDAIAAGGQPVIPVISTTAGDGATVGDPIEISGGGKKQIGIIESIVAGDSITLEDNLAFTFPKGSRVIGATKQWRRFVNRAAGEMIWDLVAESNVRFVADGQAPILRGTIETTGADGITQDLRFDNLHTDVIADVEATYGDVEMDGLTLNYRNVQGVDRTATVIFEEGKDLVELSFEENDRDSLSWVVGEGTGEAVYAILKPKAKPTRTTRKTPVKKTPVRRKAPEAPKKVELQRVEYPIFYTEEAAPVKRRREAFFEAKDVRTEALLDEQGRAILEEHAISDAVGLEVTEERYVAERDYSTGDWVRYISTSRGVDEDVRIVAIYYEEAEDPEQVRVVIDVNSRRTERLLRLNKKADQTRSSIGVRNRQPQGQLVPYSFGTSGIFDSGSPLYAFVKIPDRIDTIHEALVTLAFRQFLAPATAATSSGTLTSDSGGSSTSGASSTSSSGSDNSHFHLWATLTGGSAGGKTLKEFDDGFFQFDLATDLAGGSHITSVETAAHSHGIAHTHSTPNHSHTIPGHGHGLTYGTFEETMPVSHSATLKVYEREDTAWILRGTFTGLTKDLEDVDLLSVMTGAGDWRLTVQSEAAQPNGGRLGCDLYGTLTGSIQSA